MASTHIESEIRERVEAFASELREVIVRAALEAVREAIGATSAASPVEPGRPRARVLRPEPAPHELTPAPPPKSSTTELSLENYERMALLRALRECDNDVQAARKLLKLSKSSIYRFLSKHKIARGRTATAVVDTIVMTDEPVSLESYERLAIERALAECGGSRESAADLLGVGKSTLYRKISKHRLAP